MESIELVDDSWINVQNVQVLTPGTNIRRLIVEGVIKSEPILSCWEATTHCIPTKYEAYSTGYYRPVDHDSFGKDWTMKFVSKYKKGTRQTLKQKQ